MLKYTNILLIRILIALTIIIFSFQKTLGAKTIIATYNISWNSITLGNILWKFSLLPQSYEFSIKLNSSGVSSKLYPFYGIYSSKGIKTNGGSFKPEKYYHVWKGKRKEKLIKIDFADNKIQKLTIKPEQNIEPFIDYYELNNPTDPVSAALDLIINDDEKIVKNIFDGRRIYDMSLVSEESRRIKQNNETLILKYYELKIMNYKNVWKDHNNKDLRKVLVATGEIDKNLVLPINFKIKNKGFVFKIDYISHEIVN